jgi:hypothetical protein
LGPTAIPHFVPYFSDCPVSSLDHDSKRYALGTIQFEETRHRVPGYRANVAEAQFHDPRFAEVYEKVAIRIRGCRLTTGVINDVDVYANRRPTLFVDYPTLNLTRLAGGLPAYAQAVGFRVTPPSQRSQEIRNRRKRHDTCQNDEKSSSLHPHALTPATSWEAARRFALLE